MKPLIIAHCGDTRHAPESTLIAFERAIQQEVDVIECDLHLSKEGEFVIHHDYYLGRTTPGHGYIGNYTCAELQALDTGSWFHPQFADQRIRTLSEVLALGQYRVRFMKLCFSQIRKASIAITDKRQLHKIMNVPKTSMPSCFIMMESDDMCYSKGMARA